MPIRDTEKKQQNNSETYDNHDIGQVQLEMSHFMHTFMQQTLQCNTHCLFFRRCTCTVVSYSISVSLFPPPYCSGPAGSPVLCLLLIVAHQHSSTSFYSFISIPLFYNNGLCHPSLIVSLEIQANQRPLKGSYEWC